MLHAGESFAQHHVRALLTCKTVERLTSLRNNFAVCIAYRVNSYSTNKGEGAREGRYHNRELTEDKQKAEGRDFLLKKIKQAGKEATGERSHILWLCQTKICTWLSPWKHTGISLFALNS